MHTTDDNAEMLKEARDYANKFTALLPERIQAVSLTRKSKLPFKATTTDRHIYDVFLAYPAYSLSDALIGRRQWFNQ